MLGYGIIEMLIINNTWEVLDPYILIGIWIRIFLRPDLIFSVYFTLEHMSGANPKNKRGCESERE